MEGGELDDTPFFWLQQSINLSSKGQSTSSRQRRPFTTLGSNEWDGASSPMLRSTHNNKISCSPMDYLFKHNNPQAAIATFLPTSAYPRADGQLAHAGGPVVEQNFTPTIALQ